MTCSVAIFDLDGTLLDTLEDLADATNRALAQCGYPQHPTDSYNYFVGDGMRVLMERAAPPAATTEEVDRLCELFLREYSQCWDHRTRPYAGVENMLSELRQRNIRCAVLSNKPHDFTATCIKRFFSSKTFDIVYGQRQGVAKKPDPIGALDIARQLGVEPRECLYVGDTAVDMQTGKRAGMFTIGVLWGFRDLAELKENKADLIVQTPGEIVDHVVSCH